MIPIKKDLLINSIEYVELGINTGDGATKTVIPISNVRCIKNDVQSDYMGNKINNGLLTIYYDLANSVPNDIDFKINDKIIFENEEFEIININDYTDRNKLIFRRINVK